jgi:hypothetical protein
MPMLPQINKNIPWAGKTKFVFAIQKKNWTWSPLHFHFLYKLVNQLENGFFLAEKN